MVVQFKFYSTLREIVGRETLKLRLRRGATVQTALDLVISRYGDAMEKKLSQKENWVIMVNDKNVKFMNDSETPLKDGDRISILSPLSGG